MDATLHACEDAHDALVHAVHDCLKKGGRHAEPGHIGIMLDCAQICHTAHDFILRHSSQHQVTCRACEEICNACAKSCDAVGHADLSELCRKAASACHTTHTMAA